MYIEFIYIQKKNLYLIDLFTPLFPVQKWYQSCTARVGFQPEGNIAATMQLTIFKREKTMESTAI